MSRSTSLHCLVTAGNTLAMIDRVRGVTNIFSGRTGTHIALELHRRGHHVDLLTSRPEVVTELAAGQALDQRWRVISYRSFEELHHQMNKLLISNRFHVLIHSAAVSDYLAAGSYCPADDTHFNHDQRSWQTTGDSCQMMDVSAGKVKSNYEELWIRMKKAPKLVDLVRDPWGFQGKLVKFKLEVDKNHTQLEAIAEASRVQSDADFLVANTLEGMHEWAILGPIHGAYVEVRRTDLAHRLIDALEASCS